MFQDVFYHQICIRIIFGYTQLNIKIVLFQIIQFSINTQFKCQKELYFKLFSLVNEVKWLQLLLRIIDNLIKPQSFANTQLNINTFQFKTIQFCKSTQI